MSWARIDDSFPDHPKISGLSDRAFRIHVNAICFCARFRTDGEIIPSWFPRISCTPKVRKELVSAGLWDEIGGRFFVHDFLAYNMSRDEIESVRERNRANGARGGRPRKTQSVSESVSETETQTETESVSTGNPPVKAYPIPIPKRSSGSKEPSDLGESDDTPSAKRITKALRDELAAKYPDLDEAEQYDLARNHKSYRNAIDKRLYYRNWMRRAEEFRREREAKKPKPLPVNLPTWQERVHRLAVEEGRA